MRKRGGEGLCGRSACCFLVRIPFVRGRSVLFVVESYGANYALHSFSSGTRTELKILTAISAGQPVLGGHEIQGHSILYSNAP